MGQVIEYIPWLAVTRGSRNRGFEELLRALQKLSRLVGALFVIFFGTFCFVIGSSSPGSAQTALVRCVEVPQATLPISVESIAGWSECDRALAISNAEGVAEGRASEDISVECRRLSPLKARQTCRSRGLQLSQIEIGFNSADPPLAAPGGGGPIASFTLTGGTDIVQFCSVQRDLQTEVDSSQSDYLCFGNPRTVVFARASANCAVQCRP
jgi:hypothetical protein